MRPKAGRSGLEDFPDFTANQVKSHVVHPAVGDDIRKGARGFHVEAVHGFDGGQVLVHDIFHITSTLLGIPQDAPQNPLVRIRVHKHLDVQEIPDP